MKKIYKHFKVYESFFITIRYFLIFSLLLNSGCYFRASIVDLNNNANSDGTIPKAEKNQPAEFVSGSRQYQTTLTRKYKIFSSSGSYNRELANKTPKGYTIYSSVQGVLISNQLGGL